MCLKPAPENTGYIFVRTDLDDFEIPASVEFVSHCSYATTLMRRGVVLSTCEHLLSALRGSGVGLDLRRANPYTGYETYDFEVPTEPDGDVWSRFKVRMRELTESYKIVRQALERLRPGPIKADAPKVVLPDRDDMRKHMDSLIHHFLIVAEGFNVPAGEVYLPIEASKGELGVYMKSNGGPKPDRVHFRGPSFVNLSALPVMSEGEMIADVVAIIGSLDIVLGEIDR